MLVKTIPLEIVTAEGYDKLLASGWFRGSYEFYTSPVVRDGEEFFGVKHLRYLLQPFQFKKRHRKLIKRCEHFRVIIEPVFSVDATHELLYAHHKNRLTGYKHARLHDATMVGIARANFKVYEVSVYDNEKLIAASYFDVASNSAASITGLFDRDYSKYSLGIFTMLVEIEFCKNIGLHYYYTGYVFEDSNKFDYKMEFGNAQWRLQNGTWIDQPTNEPTIGRFFRQCLAYLKLQLEMQGIKPRKRINLLYRHGSVNANYIKYPVYFEWKEGDLRIAMTYDLSIGKYVLFSFWEDTSYPYRRNVHPAEYKGKRIYERRLMIMGFKLELHNLEEIPVREILVPSYLKKELVVLQNEPISI